MLIKKEIDGNKITIIIHEDNPVPNLSDLAKNNYGLQSERVMQAWSEGKKTAPQIYITINNWADKETEVEVELEDEKAQDADIASSDVHLSKAEDDGTGGSDEKV